MRVGSGYWLRGLVAVLLLGGVAGCAHIPFIKKAEPSTAGNEVVNPQSQVPSVGEQETAAAPSGRKGWMKWLLFWWPERPPPPPAAQALNPVGRIFLVNAPANFVLIETPAARQLPVGQRLHTLAGGGIVATVKVSPQRNPPFVVADLVEGMPRAGDRVYPVVLTEEGSASAVSAGASAVTTAPEVFTVVEDEEVSRLKPIEELLPR